MTAADGTDAEAFGRYSIEPIAGTPVLELGPAAARRTGYEVDEFLLDGIATAYRLDGPMTIDGRWAPVPSQTAEYVTRLVVVRPREAARFNGVVVLEWLNVSAGRDVAPEWLFTHRELIRRGAAWVGVSAQHAGISGGGLTASTHLKAAAPERYAVLDHPGDAFSFDIFTHAADAVRRPGGTFGPLRPKIIIAAGQSQSAAFLVTYINAVHPTVRAVDAFLVHGRASRAAWLDGEFWAPARQLRESRGRLDSLTVQNIRTDLDVPVLAVQSETDVALLGFQLGRQRNDENFRLWEIAGAAHFDTYGLVASLQDDGAVPPDRLASMLAPLDQPRGIRTSAPTNSGPQQHYVVQAALHALVERVVHGRPVPNAPRLRTRLLPLPAFARDQYGIALGGVRTPWVDAPIATLSGLGQRVRGFGFLFGSTRKFTGSQLAARYPDGRDQYQAELAESLANAITAGHILADDADEVTRLGEAQWPN
jgi:Alpha/beta hydrolase domain